MPTRNVNLTKELDRFIAKSVKSGRYANASEVLRSALRLLERENQVYEEKLAALRTALTEGDKDYVVDGEEFFDELVASFGERAKKRGEKVA